MIASGAAGGDGAIAMTTTVFQYHWTHLWFTYAMNVHFIIYSAIHCWVRNDLIQVFKTQLNEAILQTAQWGPVIEDTHVWKP